MIIPVNQPILISDTLYYKAKFSDNPFFDYDKIYD